MGSAVPDEIREAFTRLPKASVDDGFRAETEFGRYLPHLSQMSKQLRQTSNQIETSVVGVCGSFQGIAERARSTVGRATEFLGSQPGEYSGRQSFETMIEDCSDTLVKILNTTEQAGEVSRRAVDRIREMDKASATIGASLTKLEQIAHENKMLAMNARIEAAHAGIHGAGFAVVAVEVAAQTERAQEVTAYVGTLIANLRELAARTLEELCRTNQQDQDHIRECKHEVHESLQGMQNAHGEMKQMLSGMTDESALLANDIAAAVRGLQFQDRTSQQIAHVVEDLETLHAKLTASCGHAVTGNIGPDEGFSAYTTQEERQVAGISGEESAAGDVELF